MLILSSQVSQVKRKNIFPFTSCANLQRLLQITKLSLGGYLRWRGVRPEQLGWGVSTACLQAEESGMTSKEMREAVKWGYEHGSETRPRAAIY